MARCYATKRKIFREGSVFLETDKEYKGTGISVVNGGTNGKSSISLAITRD